MCVYTGNSPNCGHIGIQAFVLYLKIVPYSSVRVISSPICVVITVLILKHLEIEIFELWRFETVASYTASTQ